MKITIFGYDITIQRHNIPWYETVCNLIDEQEKLNGQMNLIERVKFIRPLWTFFPEEFVVSDSTGSYVGLRAAKEFIEQHYSARGHGARNI